MPIWYHVHDVFGMATAQAIAAASAGAVPEVSVNGVADHGFPCLEALVVSLELLYGVSTGIDMTKLPELSRAVERITGIPNSPNKAVTGDLISTPDFPRRYVGLLHGETMTRTRLYPFEMEMVGRGRRQAMSYGSLSLETVQSPTGAHETFF